MGESRVTKAKCPYGKTSQRERPVPLALPWPSSLGYCKGRMPEGVKVACPRAEAANSDCLVLTRAEGFQSLEIKKARGHSGFLVYMAPYISVLVAKPGHG